MPNPSTNTYNGQIPYPVFWFVHLARAGQTALIPDSLNFYPSPQSKADTLSFQTCPRAEELCLFAPGPVQR